MVPEEEWYIGLELGSEQTMISAWGNGRKEPETKGLVAGGQNYRIPTAICKRKGTEQWYLAERQEGIYIENLLERALQDSSIEAEGIYQAKELFIIFLRKVLRLALPPEGIGAVTRCVFSVEEVTEEIAELLMESAEQIGLQPEQILIQDNKESFYAYAVSQKQELWLYDVVLFSGENGRITCWEMQHDKKTAPQVCGVSEQYLGEFSGNQQRDREFTEMVKQVLAGRIVSAVYLTGEEFEGGWMKESLQMICRGRRAFQGKNLYTKGACYSGMLQVHAKEAETIYFSPYKTSQNVFFKAVEKEREYMYPLAEAGKNICQIRKKVCILLEDEPILEVFRQHPGKREAVIESLELTGLELLPGSRCRLELQIKGKLAAGLILSIKDIGFGELLPGSGQEWEYEIG